MRDLLLFCGKLLINNILYVELERSDFFIGLLIYIDEESRLMVGYRKESSLLLLGIQMYSNDTVDKCARGNIM
jgi:hypothetical protein